MKFVDIHTHKAVPDFDEIIVSNIDYFALKRGDFKLLPIIFYSIGFHPWYADQITDEDFDNLEAISQNKQVKIMGECGLDKLCDVDFEIQITIFKKQIEISESLALPLIIHCVKSFNELFELYKEIKPSQKWIIHGFRQKPQLAKQALDLGFYLSFGEKFNAESVEMTPFDRLLVETDESKTSIADIYNAIVSIKNCKTEKLNAGINLLK